MSYYILPKNIHIINVNPIFTDGICKPYISHTLLNYYFQVKEQINDILVNDPDLSNNTFENATKIVNPYEFLFSKVPGSKFSVSKFKPQSSLFYDLLEISSNLNIFDFFHSSQLLNFLHISINSSDSIDCFEIFREGSQNIHVCDIKENDTKFDFIFYETDISNYFKSIIHSLIIILSRQNINGVCIIKIHDIFYKPIADALYLLSSLYDKVYICKPSTNNITSFDRYIVCKNFLHGEQSNTYLKLNYLKLFIFLEKLENKNIASLLEFDVPYYFKNKLDDLNIIIGQQQLEALDQIITIYKNKNKDDKVEIIKKNNIQKSVSWCEKYKIPCNKFAEKINIFLPIINEI